MAVGGWGVGGNVAKSLMNEQNVMSMLLNCHDKHIIQDVAVFVFVCQEEHADTSCPLMPL